MIDSRIRHYTIQERIGRGGMGVVYLARDTSLERKVAVKLLSDALRAEASARSRFLREAKAAAAIDHPYICKIYEAGEHDGEAYIVMEYVEGATLEHRLKESPLPLKDLIRVALQTADALGSAHAGGFVHRDLKPSNIMLTLKGQHVKVMDFGLAKRLESPPEGAPGEMTTLTMMTRPGAVVGTPLYMSPEQISGKDVDHRSDLFSLGVILYEAVSGAHPFRRGDTIQTALAICNEEAPPLRSRRPDCPEPLEGVIARLMRKAKKDRYASAGDLEEDLRALQEGSVPSVSVSVPPEHDSIAVLPFVNLGGKEEDEYFSDDITEEIIAWLGRIAGIVVISRTSVMRYKGTDKDIATIGRELGVGTVLEGSVRRAGDRLRISCVLYEVEGGRQIWSESFDREIRNIFAVQTEVSRRVAEELRSTLASGEMRLFEKSGPGNVDAYHEYLKGRYFLNRLTQEDLQKSIAHFRAALDLDPVYALAYSGMSTAYANAGYFGYPAPADPFPKARAAAGQALRLDDSLGEAHASMALVNLLYEWKLDAAEREFRQALAINPNHAEARTLYSWYVAAMGRLEEAVAEARRAVTIDPLSPFTNMNLGWVLFYAKRYDEAVDQLEQTLEIAPGFPHARMSLACALLMGDRKDEGVRIFEECAFTRSQVAQAYACGDRHDRAREVLREVISQDPVREPAFDVALIHFFLGEGDPAFEWLDKALAQRDPRLIYLRDFPPMEPWRDDPRLTALLGRAGLIA